MKYYKEDIPPSLLRKSPYFRLSVQEHGLLCYMHYKFTILAQVTSLKDDPKI